MTSQFPYIDIHTHKFREDEKVIQILNDDSPSAQFKSLGIHPWDIKDLNIEKEIEDIKQSALAGDLIAFGEIGLDRTIDTPLETQEEIFLKQLKIAQEYNTPVIVHCVKAYSEIIHTQKKNGITVPIIFHGFSGNKDTVRTLIDHNYYMSFGMRELSRKRIKDVLTQIPLSKIFFETDMADRGTIEEVYQLAVKLTGLDEKYLKQRVYDNFVTCFGDIYDLGIAE